MVPDCFLSSILCPSTLVIFPTNVLFMTTLASVFLHQIPFLPDPKTASAGLLEMLVP